MPVRRAVIDVGTNSIKLLVAAVEHRDIRPLLEESRQTRLGRGFYPEHMLQPGPIAQTAEAVAEFASKARTLGAESIRVVATSAARDARNQRQLLSAIEEACGLPVRVISGEEEANYGFRGVTTDPELAREHLLLLDVGGGSAEFILGLGENIHLAHSFPIGTVRLIEQLQLADPPQPDQLAECRARLMNFLKVEIGPKVLPALRREAGGRSPQKVIEFVAVGGTATILGCMEARLDHFDRERLQATRLSRDRLHWHVNHLWGLPISERKKIIGLPANRADVILAGAAIYEAVMDFFDFEQLRVSTRGLRFALVLEENQPKG
ncbi:MAG TPA: Ppx/GppA family phosphatase [Patescibacteria group bacterium]|nr:Ppx/GppA family phosphatase [Patescibacteria group bacterium]